MTAVEENNVLVEASLTEMKERMDKTETSFADTCLLVDAVRKSAEDTNAKVEKSLAEQAEEKAALQSRLGRMEKAAQDQATKMENISNGFTDIQDEINVVKTDMPKLRKDLEELQLDQSRSVHFSKVLEKDLKDLTARVEGEMAGISDTLTQARDMQATLAEELARMQRAAEASENIMDEIRAEQAAGLRKIEQRIDRTDGMLKLKATHADIVMLLGQKADRDVIDKLAEERMQFLRDVSAQMHDVENKVVDKPDREDLEGLARETTVRDLVKSTAADLTTFVNDSVHEATANKADIADCKFLEKRITEVTGEIIELTNEEREKVDSRLEALRGQVSKKADEAPVRKMRKTITALAHAQLEDQSGDSASLFFRCLSCDTKLPKLQGAQAMQALSGMIPQQPAAPAVQMLEQTAATNAEMRTLLEQAAGELDGAVQQPALDLPHASTGRRLLLTGSDGRLYKGAFADGSG